MHPIAKALRDMRLQFEDAQEAARKIGEVFRAPAMRLAAARLEQLRTMPLPADLAVWESEGGALGE
jgi:hypothetical protein